MPGDTTTAGTQDAPSSALQSVQSQLPQIIGTLLDGTQSNSGDVVTALNAVASAINAKPSA